jgi:hypothetical protein
MTQAGHGLVVDRITPTHRRIRLIEQESSSWIWTTALRASFLLAGGGMLLAGLWQTRDVLGAGASVSAALLFSLGAAACFVVSALLAPPA